mmetsp:Transcript_32426/g.69072  ORF Transcript_32426/g.69072 Transcript_32426/m.69072 type:complete len:223 (-) Transcript_32426:210-878(-)
MWQCKVETGRGRGHEEHLAVISGAPVGQEVAAEVEGYVGTEDGPQSWVEQEFRWHHGVPLLLQHRHVLLQVLQLLLGDPAPLGLLRGQRLPYSHKAEARQADSVICTAPSDTFRQAVGSGDYEQCPHRDANVQHARSPSFLCGGHPPAKEDGASGEKRALHSAHQCQHQTKPRRPEVVEAEWHGEDAECAHRQGTSDDVLRANPVGKNTTWHLRQEVADRDS